MHAFRNQSLEGGGYELPKSGIIIIVEAARLRADAVHARTCNYA